mgnify:CR=1 FL=1
MKLGIFDSGLGGLVIAKAIHEEMPDLDFVYFGDTIHIPYGNRSQDVIYDYTVQGIEFLFSQGCNLVVLACNTASAFALRKVQQEYLPLHHQGKGRNVLGVVVPTLEEAVEEGFTNIGLIATAYTVGTDIYGIELKKIRPDIQLHQNAAPLLVPLVENDGLQWAPPILEHYLRPLLDKKIEALVLACTHYPFLKSQIQNIAGPVKLLSQDEIIPRKLRDYLERHAEYKLSRQGSSVFYVSDLTSSYQKAAEDFYGSKLTIEKVSL